MKVIYIAHRLSGDWEGNTANARLFAEAAARSGHAPVAPYLTLDGLLIEEHDRDLGVAIDMAMIPRCDEVWLCGPTVSAGMVAEADQARRHRRLVFRWEDPDDPAGRRPWWWDGSAWGPSPRLAP